MRLNTLANSNIPIDDQPILSEARVSLEPIQRPIGISKEEWTPDLIEHFERIRRRNPKLWNKIENGN